MSSAQSLHAPKATLLLGCPQLDLSLRPTACLEVSVSLNRLLFGFDYRMILVLLLSLNFAVVFKCCHLALRYAARFKSELFGCFLEVLRQVMRIGLAEAILESVLLAVSYVLGCR